MKIKPPVECGGTFLRTGKDDTALRKPEGTHGAERENTPPVIQTVRRFCAVEQT